MNPLPVRGHGLSVDVMVDVDRPRMRTVRGHGQFASVAGTGPDHDRGQAAFAAISNPYCAAVSRLCRDRFAATRTLAC
jgi:hypothetical protein